MTAWVSGRGATADVATPGVARGAAFEVVGDRNVAHVASWY